MSLNLSGDCDVKRTFLAYLPNHCPFNIAHHPGWASMTISEKVKLMQVRPFLDYATYEEAVRWMWAHRQPLPINDENWGCRQDHLQEVCIRAQIPEGGQTNA